MAPAGLARRLALQASGIAALTKTVPAYINEGVNRRNAANASVRAKPMATATPTLRFTADQYDLMIRAGVFASPTGAGALPEQPPRVELIRGEIVMPSPIGTLP